MPTNDLQKCECCVTSISRKYSYENYNVSHQLETKVGNSLQYDSDGDLILERPSEQCHEDIEPVRKKFKILDTEGHLPKSENKKTVECNEKIEDNEQEKSCCPPIGHTSLENLTGGSNELDSNDHKTENIRNSFECEPLSSAHNCDLCDVVDSHSPEPITDKCQCMTNSKVLPTLQNCKDCTSNNEVFFINISE